MSDTAPFSPFSPVPPPKPMFEGEVAGNPATRGKKTGRKKPPKAAKPQPRGKPRKPRTPKAVGATGGAIPPGMPDPVPTRRRARKPRPTMIPIGILPALGGLQEAETSMLMSIIGNLQDVPKKSRLKIVAALSKVFA